MFALITWMQALVSRAALQERGQAMVEYALILAIISIAAVAAMALLGPEIVTAIDSVTAAF